MKQYIATILNKKSYKPIGRREVYEYENGEIYGWEVRGDKRILHSYKKLPKNLYGLTNEGA